MWLYFLGLFIHFMLLLSASDIFFENYIATSGEWVCEHSPGTAKRLVFIVADGLSEEQLIGRATGNVSSALYGHGTWGRIVVNNINSRYYSNQALTSGFSVSPFTTYFSRFIIDPEPTDNFLNRSNNVFYFGEEEVYDSIYKEESNPWWTYFYPEWERSIVANTSFAGLRSLTVDAVNNLFISSNSNDAIKKYLNDSKTSFVFQLGFVARAGQIFGYNTNYTTAAADNLLYTVESLVEIIENYYKGDGKTAYILCSNYKPEDGNYGTDYSYNFEGTYPFVAWGAGITHNKRPVKIRQIDVAPLVSALLATDVPRNSRGFIPYPIVNLTRDSMARAQICNAMQLYSLAVDSESSVPFNGTTRTVSVQFIHSKLESLRLNKSYIHLSAVIRALNHLSYKKLLYNESVFKTVVWYCTILTLFGWILLICSEILPFRESLDNKSVISFTELKIRMASRLSNINNQMLFTIRKKIFPKQAASERNKVLDESIANEASYEMKSVLPEQENSAFGTSNLESSIKENRKSVITWRWLRGLTDIIFFITISVIVMTLFVVEWPPLFVYYLITPVILFWLCTYSLIDWMVFAKEYFRSAWREIIIYGLIFIFAGVLIIKGLDQGQGLAFGVILILQSLAYMQTSSWSIAIAWLACGCCLVVSADRGLWIASAPLEWGLVISIIALILWNLYATFRLIPKGMDFAVTVALLWQDGMSLGCVLFTDAIHSAGHTTPFALKLLCWFSVLFVFLPAIHRRDLSSLVLNICMALSVPFILLSTTFEPLLFLLLSNFMISWMILEGYCDEGKASRQLNGEDVRRALLFTFFCFLTSSILGNSYSFINANLFSIRCLTETIYEPTVWAILFLKPTIIYIMLTVIFLIVCLSNGIKIDQGFNLVLLIAQYIITMMFFQITVENDGNLSKASIMAAVKYFMLNIIVIILISAVLVCKYIYRLPMQKVV